MNSVFVISECGINHNGDFNAAKAQVKASKEAGADAAKFQFYDPLSVLGPESPYLAYAQQCQFNRSQHEELKAYCDSIGIEYMCSVFDLADVAWVDGLVKRHKVASRMNKNQNFIEALMRTDKDVVMSVQNIHLSALHNVRYMWCVTNYPTKLEDFAYLPCGPKMGLSSHCPSIAPSLKAVAQGSVLIENHTTFSRDLPGCDQASSLTYDELERMVKVVRDLERMA